MAGGKFSEAQLYGMTIRESANDGSDFTNPAADYRRLFLGEDGELHTKDSAGTVAGFAGTGIAATLADNAGDMLVASAADTWAKLATPTVNGQVIMRVGGSVAWALPSGHVFAHDEITANSTSTATSEGTATTAITGSAVTYDGSTAVIVEVNAPSWTLTATAAGQAAIMDLYEDSTILGRIAVLITPAAAAIRVPVFARWRRTPSNASHQYVLKHWISAGTNSIINADTGGTGKVGSAFLRVTKA